MAKSKDLNLLNPLASPKGFWENLYYWVVTVGRYVIISTLVIVIVIFFARFGLDAVLSSDQSHINSDVASIQSTYTFEQKMLKLQNQLSSLNTVYRQQINQSNNVSAFFSLIPSTVYIMSIDFNSTGVALTGVIDNYADLQSLNNAFLASPLYKDISVTQLNKTKQTYGVNFSLKANYVSTSFQYNVSS